MNLLELAQSNPRIRGDVAITGSDGKEYRLYVCNGGPCCWKQDDAGHYHEYYPHILSMEVVHKVTRVSL